MAGLTRKNKEAIDLYLSEDPECKRNGTAAWMRVYKTKNRATAKSNWYRMLTNADAKHYLMERNVDIEDARKDIIAFDRDRYMQELEKLLQAAKKPKQYMVDGEPVELPGTVENIGEGRRICHDMYAAHTGNLFPGQEEPMKVNIQINTGKHLDVVDEVKKVEKPPRVFTQKPRQRIIIGKRS